MLNKNFLTKKFWIFILIIIIIIIFFILFFCFKKNNRQNNYVDSNKTFTTTDSSITFTLPSDFQFEEKKNDSFLLALESSSTKSGMYVSTMNIDNTRNVSELIEYDRNNFVSLFDNVSDVSDVSSLNVQNFEALNYHFNYGENNYVDVYWIIKDSCCYVIDFRANKNEKDFSLHINDVLNSLKFN